MSLYQKFNIKTVDRYLLELIETLTVLEYMYDKTFLLTTFSLSQYVLFPLSESKVLNILNHDCSTLLHSSFTSAKSKLTDFWYSCTNALYYKYVWNLLELSFDRFLTHLWWMVCLQEEAELCQKCVNSSILTDLWHILKETFHAMFP